VKNLIYGYLLKFVIVTMLDGSYMMGVKDLSRNISGIAFNPAAGWAH
jgi:hypothetical protein